MQFGTDQIISIQKSNLCQDQYITLQGQLLKAKEHGKFLNLCFKIDVLGTITFSVEFRRFNYQDWYKDLPTQHLYVSKDEDPDYLSRNQLNFERIQPNLSVMFETHNRDEGTGWDEWWNRHSKFAKTSK